MIAKRDGDFIKVRPIYGGAELSFDVSTRIRRIKFALWYVKYLCLWKDPITWVDNQQVNTYGLPRRRGE